MRAAALVFVLGAATACRHDERARPAPSPSASARPSEEARVVRLDARPAHVSDKEKSDRKSSLSLSIEFWQENEKLGSNESVRSEEYSRETEVLGIEGGAPAKIRVRYGTYHRIESQPDRPKVDTSLLAGHTYLVDATTPPIRATTDLGKPVSQEELETLQKLHGELGHDDAVVAALGEAPITVGQSVPLRRVLFEALVGSGAGEFKSGTVVLAAVRPEAGREAAVFQWSGEMKTTEENGLEITWHLRGEAVIGISPARTLRTKVEGALDAEGETLKDGARVRLAGAGTFSDERTIAPL